MLEATLAGVASVRFTGRAEGDLGHHGRWVAADAVDPDVVARRRAVLDRPWSWLRQVHGARVVTVAGPGDGAGEEADASVSLAAGTALVVLTADCGPVAFASPEGVTAVAHAGHPGVAGGVIGATVEAMRALGATDIEAALGPCIHPECYEFGADHLAALVAQLGAHVRSETAWGTPAFDLPAAIAGQVAAAGATLVHASPTCTACATGPDGEPLSYSHRARKELERQAVVVWLP